jgi:hypothetical protein
LDGFDVSGDSLRRLDPALCSQGTFTSVPAELAHDYRLIVVANVMHHIPIQQRSGIVQKLTERLSPEGFLAIFEHNPANPITRWVVERCPFDADAVLLPPREISAYATNAKLRLRRRDFIVFMPRALAWLRPLEPWLAKLPLGAQYVVVAQKYA